MKNPSANAGERLAVRVSVNTIVINALLSALKLAAGIFAHSGAMISDAVHSLSDVLSTFIVIIGVKLSGRASDREHPYGHERVECVAAILLAVLLAATGIAIGYSGIQKIAQPEGARAVPGALALIAAIVSIVVKETMYWYTRAAAKKLNSGALMADAWHHRSDALSSVGSFAGILGARMGMPVLDPVASLVICLFILKVSFDIFKDALRKMVDTACDEDTVAEMRRVIITQSGVAHLDRINTRLFGNRVYMDVEIAVPGDLPLSDAHRISECVHDAVERNFPNVKHCMVHVNPAPRASLGTARYEPD